MANCSFLYATGGIRLRSGSATVRLVIDGAERELRVVRNGRGKSRLGRGEIKLDDLADYVLPGETVVIRTLHRGVELQLELDPRTAEGEAGRRGVRDLDDVLQRLDPVRRSLLAELQLETLPTGARNAAEARTRLKWALEQADRPTCDDEALLTAARLLDAETTRVLIERHAVLASRLAFAAAVPNSDPALSQALTSESRAALIDAGLLTARGEIAALADLGFSNEEVQAMAGLRSVLDREHGVLVGGVPGAVWALQRRGGLQTVASLKARAEQQKSSLETDKYGSAHHMVGTVWTVGERSIVFGARPGSDWGPGVEVVARNPYEISGLAETSAAGRELAVKFTAAIAAASAPERLCMEEHSGRCSHGARCIACVNDPMRPLRDAAIALVGPGERRKAGDSTFVDALLVESCAGNEQARVEFEALAELGERMINVTKRVSEGWALTERMRAEFKAAGNMAYSFDEPMRDAALDSWRHTQLARIDGMLARGEITQEWAEHLSKEAEKWSAPTGYGTEYRDKVAGEINQLKETSTPSYGFRTANLGLDEMYFVHETAYAPQIDEQGNVLLRPTGDYSEEYERTTVHFSVNHTAQGHMFRQGDDARYVIIVRAKEMLEANPDSLDCLYAIDSSLSPMPGEPLVLPAGAVRTIDYATVESAHAESSTTREEARTSRVVSEMNAMQRALTGDEEARVMQFAGGSHYSTSNVDHRLREIAAQLGVTSSLHQNLPSSRYERVPLWGEHSASSLYADAFSVEELATMSRGARARMMTHGRWLGVGSEMVRDESSIV